VTRLETTDKAPAAQTVARICYRKPELAKLIGISMRTLDRREADGCGVPGKFLLGSTALWDAVVVDRWVAERSGRAE